MLCYCSIYMSNKIDTLNIYTLLHEEVLQVVSTKQGVQLMIYNGLPEAYIHTMRKCHLRECNMILTPIDAVEH